MADFPVPPLQSKEIPLAADIDLVGEGYTLTPDQLTFHGNYGTADIELLQSDPPSAIGATPNAPDGCLAGEPPGGGASLVAGLWPLSPKSFVSF